MRVPLQSPTRFRNLLFASNFCLVRSDGSARMRLEAFARRVVFPTACLMMLHFLGATADHARPNPSESRTRIAIVGLDHDHVWGLLKYLKAEPDAELVAIAEHQPALVKEAKSRVQSSVKFYPAYVPMFA